MADEDSGLADFRVAKLRVLRDIFRGIAVTIVLLVVHMALEAHHRYWMVEQNALILQAIHEVCRNRSSKSVVLSHRILVKCKNEADQTALMSELMNRGYDCSVSTINAN